MCDDPRHERARSHALRAYVLSIVALVLGTFGFTLSLTYLVAVVS